MRFVLVVLGVAALSVPACTGVDATSGSDPGPNMDEGGTTADGSTSGTLPEAGSGCNASAAPRCDGNTLVTCSSAGVAEITPCALDCDAAQGRCKSLRPTIAASDVDISAATATKPIDLPDTILIEADTGFIGRRNPDGTSFGTPIRAAGAGTIDGVVYAVVDQTGAPKLAVFGFAALSIGAATTVKVVGTNAVALMAKGPIAVDGHLSARGDCAVLPRIAGPGGFLAGLPAAASDGAPGGGLGGAVDAVNPFACGGCGGGGNGTAGTFGGNAVDGARVGSGGLGGMPRGKTILVEPILAGGGGGGCAGGPGGGALALLASGEIRVTGVVEAGGCGGGKAGFSNSNSCGAGGGGGGAGGTIFFEAPTVVVASSGRVLANGGGGGGGSNGMEGLRADGSDASSTDATPAPGGASGQFGSVVCNKGAAGSPAAANQPLQCDHSAGSTRAAGGAGGAGHIAARTKEGVAAVVSGAVVSPAFLNEFVQTR